MRNAEHVIQTDLNKRHITVLCNEQLQEGDVHYLASPYTDDNKIVMAERYRAALEALSALTKAGYIVNSPIVHYHPGAVKYDMGRCFLTYKKSNDEAVKRCDVVLVLRIPGWQESRGVAHELSLASQEGKRVVYIEVEK